MKYIMKYNMMKYITKFGEKNKNNIKKELDSETV